MIPGIDMQALSRLARLRLSGFVALSTATGYVTAWGDLSPALLGPALAALLLAAGASALNQYQERDLDARMDRTRDRPIPSGRISPGKVLGFSLLSIAVALLMLALTGGTLPLVLGAIAIISYNGLYTRLKRRTAFAAIPGALIGSLGPAIGWTAAGGTLDSKALLAIMLVFYLWQVPHFWLLNLRYPDDYAGAGYPCPVEVMGRKRLTRLTAVWISSAAIASLLFPLFGFFRSAGLYVILCVAVVTLGTMLIGMFRSQGANEQKLRLGFASVNLYVLVTMLLLLADRGLYT
ncbi:protoheme IX farnesyltransferase [Gemmatimonadota bacterium]